MILQSGVRFTSSHPRLMESAIASVPTSTALTSGGQGNGRVAISKLSGTDTCNMKAALAPRALAARTAAAPRPANQTASQPVQHTAIVWVRPQTSLTATAALSGVPEITDTEEVTGTNPVSPTSIIPRRRACDSLQVRSQPSLSAAHSTARRWTSILTPFAPAQRSSSGHIPPVS
jgi:hypothetical protein